MDSCSECIRWRSVTSLYDWTLVVGETLTIVLPENCKQDCHKMWDVDVLWHYHPVEETMELHWEKE